MSRKSKRPKRRKPPKRAKDRYLVFTDGGADPNPGPGGWGAVLLPPNDGEIRELSGGEPHTTNNRMELTAAIRALEEIPPGVGVELYTDSRYLQQGVTQWLAGWIARGWKRKGGEIRNLDLWKRLASLEEEHDVNFHWLKGHAGHEHNERADDLATQEIRKLQEDAKPQTPEDLLNGKTADARVFLKVSGSPKLGLWAALILEGEGYDEEERRLTGPRHDESANRLDLLAACQALESLPAGACIVVHTPSDYLAQGASKWIEGWKKKGWKTKSGKDVANRDLWERLDALQAHRDVTWVRWSDGHEGEERALAELLRRAREAG